MADGNGDPVPAMAIPQGFMLPQVSPPASLNLKQNKVENWKLWKQIWENYLIVSQLNKQNDVFQVALFLSVVGVKSADEN